MSAVTLLLVGLLIVAAVLGGFIERQRFSFGRGSDLQEQNQALQETVTRLSTRVEQQRRQIENLTFAAKGEQARQILESLGWRPLAGGSLPRDGQSILLIGLQTTSLRQAPSGYHYARYNGRSGNQALLSHGGATDETVELNGTILWTPQRAAPR